MSLVSAASGCTEVADPLLSSLILAADAAQNESALAEVALLEAQARANTARAAVSRLLAAVAAMKGEVPNKEPPENKVKSEKPRKTRKEEHDNPLTHLKCKGCGVAGKLEEQYHTAPSGALVRMLVCTGCKNQMMMG